MELLLALHLSIYDAPSDKQKVVVELCGPIKCARLLTDKATLETDYEKIYTWAAQAAEELEPN